MSIIRGLPTRRTPKNNRNTNSSISSGQTSSGWDRFNNKHTPEQKRTYRDKWIELYPDEPLIPPRFSKTSQETQKEYLRRMWNVVFPDDQIDWENVKPHLYPDIWVRFYSDFASEEEMYLQDQEEEVVVKKYTPEQEMELWEQYYGKELDEWGNPIDDDPHPLRTKSLYNKY